MENKKVPEEKKEQLDTNNLCARLHFYEFLVRISLEKYSYQTPAEAFKRLVSEHLRPAMKVK